MKTLRCADRDYCSIARANVYFHLMMRLFCSYTEDDKELLEELGRHCFESIRNRSAAPLYNLITNGEILAGSQRV